MIKSKSELPAFLNKKESTENKIIIPDRTMTLFTAPSKLIPNLDRKIEKVGKVEVYIKALTTNIEKKIEKISRTRIVFLLKKKSFLKKKYKK